MARQDASSSIARPLRTCIGCRRRLPQRSLIRFGIRGSAIVVDASQRLPGRGAYLCRRDECATRVLADPRRLAQALRTGRDRVTVDTRTLLQDWEARRDDCDGSADKRNARGDERCADNPRRASSVGDGT